MINPIAARRAMRALPAASRISAVRFTSSMHDGDPHVLETEKQRNLSGTQKKTSTPHPDHAPGWNESLASASEAAVKADQSTVSKDDLAAQTVEYVQRRHHPEERTSSHNAPYERDTVGGPLSGAGAGTVGAVAGEIEGKTTVKETTTELRKTSTTPSEEAVKADRGEN